LPDLSPSPPPAERPVEPEAKAEPAKMTVDGDEEAARFRFPFTLHYMRAR
jgi:hypothetical protein